MSEIPEISPPSSIVFVGLGQMGVPMSKQLTDAGYLVMGVDPSPAAREAFKSFGGQAYENLESALLSSPDVAAIITMLPDGKIVRQVLLEDGNPLANITEKTLIIDMSSSAPTDTRTLEKALTQKNIGIIDAPVSGGVKKAISGELAIMCGGKSDCIKSAKILLEAMGARIFDVGPIGAGHAMKALNNYVSAAGFSAASEALLVGRAFDIEPDTMIDVLNASTGKNNSTELKMKQFVLSESFASGFSLALMAKDLQTASALSQDMDLSTPMLFDVAREWASAFGQLGNTADHTEYFKYAQSESQRKSQS